MVFLFALCSILFQTSAALAQNSGAIEPERRIIAWTNPILFVFGWYMLEAEIRLQDNHTVGISGSFLQFEDEEPGEIDYQDTEYVSVNVFYRYYPTGSFKGFFIGGQLGTVQVDNKENVEGAFGIPTGEIEETSFSATSVGVLIGYSWLLGDAQRIGVSLGIGANRLFGGDVDDADEDILLTLPVVRLINVGIAF